MKGRALDHAKKSWNGQMERRALLASEGIELPDELDGPPGRVPSDDILDAAAAAWTAWRCVRNKARALPGRKKPAIAERGIIWV